LLTGLHESTAPETEQVRNPSVNVVPVFRTVNVTVPLLLDADPVTVADDGL
jgi:hypothetical protein